MTVLVGGVAELYQGDLDFGRHVVERLVDGGVDGGAIVEDLSYGAVAVSQRLQDLRPAALVLVGSCARGRPPGTLERRRHHPLAPTPMQARQSVAEAITGYVTIDLVLEVASALGSLPRRTVTIELEPVASDPAEQLSSEAAAAVEPALALVRAELHDIAALRCRIAHSETGGDMGLIDRGAGRP